MYLERPDDHRWRHTQWLKKVKTSFNKLNEKDKSDALKALGALDGKNGKERKEIFSKLILNREQGYEKIQSILKGVNK